MRRVESKNFTPHEGLEFVLFETRPSSVELPDVDEGRIGEISPEFRLLIGELSPEDYLWTLSPDERDTGPQDDF